MAQFAGDLSVLRATQKVLSRLNSASTASEHGNLADLKKITSQSERAKLLHRKNFPYFDLQLKNYLENEATQDMSRMAYL